MFVLCNPVRSFSSCRFLRSNVSSRDFRPFLWLTVALASPTHLLHPSTPATATSPPLRRSSWPPSHPSPRSRPPRLRRSSASSKSRVSQPASHQPPRRGEGDSGCTGLAGCTGALTLSPLLLAVRLSVSPWLSSRAPSHQLLGSDQGPTDRQDGVSTPTNARSHGSRTTHGRTMEATGSSDDADGTSGRPERGGALLSARAATHFVGPCTCCFFCPAAAGAASVRT